MRVNRAQLGLAVLTLPTFLVAMDMTALLLALPRLSAGLGATSVEQLWISDSYGFMVAGLVITMGTLGDRIGRRRLLMAGAAAFAAASVAAALAVSPLMLIVARALLGIAGATLALGTGPLFALGTGLVVGSVPPERAGSAASMSETGSYFGGSLGFALLGVLAAATLAMRGRAAGPAAATPQSTRVAGSRRERLRSAANRAASAGWRVAYETRTPGPAAILKRRPGATIQPADASPDAIRSSSAAGIHDVRPECPVAGMPCVARASCSARRRAV